MNLASLIVMIILILICAGIVFYLYKQKRKGNSCIGCSCGSGCNGTCKKQ